jgi:hypothetical protein
MKSNAKKASGRQSSKKSPPAGKPDAQKIRLRKELAEAITQIDEEGLLFLLRQANVLIHNARVDALNREEQEMAAKARKSAPTSRKIASSPTHAAIEESPDKKVIFLVLGKTRKVMSLDEMKQLVHICYSAESKSDALRQIFTVLARERKDILVDAGIGSPSNPLMEALFHAVRGTYQLQER